MDKRLPLQYLNAFRAIARSENLREAAAQLHLSHSALSQQLQALESQLGLQLFERQGRRLKLNRHGELLQGTVEEALGALERRIASLRSLDSQALPRLRVSALPSFASRWLAPRLSAWQARHPDIVLELHSSQRLVDLEREGFHAALRQGRGPWPGLENTPLMRSRLVVVAAPALAHALIGEPIEALLDCCLIGSELHWRQWFQAAGFDGPWQLGASFNDAGLALQAAETGMGVALAREWLAADALLAGRLVRVSGLALPVEAEDGYHLVCPPALREEPSLGAFRSWLLAEMAQCARALRVEDLPPDA